jgi:Carboxypeptidase regulatory-like domain
MLFYKNVPRSYYCDMKTLIRVVVVVFASLCLMLRAHAGEAGLSGIVEDSKGQPIQGAEIRIQGSDPNMIGKVHTKANGQYNYSELEAGTYAVTLLVDGVTKASISNVRTRAGETQTLNFEILKGSRATPFAPGKHYVWVPKQTGSHLGAWVEVEGEGTGMSVGMAERLNNQGNALVRHIQNSGDQGFPR